MKKIYIFITLLLMSLFITIPIKASNIDMSYSVSITLNNLTDSKHRVMLATLGPGQSDYKDESVIYKKALPDDYYFSSAYKDFTGTSVRFDYYGPISRNFIVVISDEITGDVFQSKELTCYGATSYFACNFNEGLNFVKNFNYGLAVGMFILRMALIIIAQISLAYIFKFNKKSHYVICATNTILQFFANLYLNIQTYNFGLTAKSKAIGCAILFGVELLIFAIEQITFSQYCTMKCKVVDDNSNNEARKELVESKKYIWLYTLLICLITYFIGMISLITW